MKVEIETPTGHVVQKVTLDNEDRGKWENG